MRISNKKVRFINCPMDNVPTIFHNHGAMLTIVVQCPNSVIVVQLRNHSCGGACYTTCALGLFIGVGTTGGDALTI